MEKKLTKTGNSLALVLDRELLEKTGSDVIVVSPRRAKGRADKLRKVMARADERYGGVFRRLAK
jgi:antitoxin component of MazEF toxin-antitoxin module